MKAIQINAYPRTSKCNHFLPYLNFGIFFWFLLGGKKIKSHYLNEVQNGCTRSRIRIGTLDPSHTELKLHHNLNEYNLLLAYVFKRKRLFHLKGIVNPN